MRKERYFRQRLAALGIFGFPLLSFPLLGLPEGEWFGLPASYAYIFVVWFVLLALAGWLAEWKAD